MASNPYLQWYTNSNEQQLIDDLVVEGIRNHAHDVYYLPRTGVAKDDLLNENNINRFDSALPVEVYVKNFDGFEGEGELVSKFGFEIRNQMTLQMSIRSFEEFIKPTTQAARPLEGDCIYIPMLEVVYQIKYINASAIMYTLGKLQSYEITCELLDYTNEQFNTGIAEIDTKYPAFQHEANNAYDLDQYDTTADNSPIQTDSDLVLNFDELDPFEVGQH